MARVLNVSAFRQETLAATLPPTGESGATGLGAHARPETVLTFPSPFRRLKSAFHTSGRWAAKAATLGTVDGLSTPSSGAARAAAVLLWSTRCCAASPIVHWRAARHVHGMTTSAPLRLSVEDKLDALRSLDRQGHWESLDDQRYCTRCDRVITGRQIEVAGGTRGHGPLRLECPTDGCPATPQDWTHADQPRSKNAGPSTDGASSDDGTHNAGYVHIRAESGGIYITHNGHAAVVQRTRSGPVVPLSELTQFNEEPAPRSRFLGWLLRRTAAIATDFRSSVKLLRRNQRGGQFRPVH